MLVQVDSDNILLWVAILVSLSAGQYSLAVLSYVNAGSDSQRVLLCVRFRSVLCIVCFGPHVPVYRIVSD